MLLADMSKEELEIIARERQADLVCALETKKRVLDKNKQLVAQVVELNQINASLQQMLESEMDRVEILERENYYLIKKLRDNGLI